MEKTLKVNVGSQIRFEQVVVVVVVNRYDN